MQNNRWHLKFSVYLVVNYLALNIIPHTPSPILKSAVRQMWIVEEESGIEIEVNSFPVGYPFINVISSDKFILRGSHDEVLKTNSYLVGQTLSPFSLYMKLIKRAITIQLVPSAIPSLFGLNAHEFFEKRISLADLSTDLAHRLEDLIESNLSSREVLSKTDSYLSRCIKNNEDEPRMHRALQLLIETAGGLKMKELAFELNLSQRRMQQLFKENIGVPGKSYARIIKLQHHTFKLLQNDTIEQIVPDGYFDQSHFIHDLKGQTGMLPDTFKTYINDPSKKRAYYFSNIYFGYEGIS
ncbi:helix-turn-helix domain-containing protein [Pricia sp. S334]|uniref:Helix-turn-helix domain-containing protein n=1 Tax=Pricia mediterranea TaxID=3076079 RepID=A0ABU3L0M4_9FLAO|nr:helix-turn-helix domain-containing protein [Pricia sp. S334]MDT7827133.1 helix-turn-helix domain-containing protein [Pricia sp. S334]